MTRSQWALRRKATTRKILRFRHEYRCVGLRDRISIPVSQWCMIFADDILLGSTIREEVEKKVRQGLHISRDKTVYTTGSMYIGTWMGTQISIYT